MLSSDGFLLQSPVSCGFPLPMMIVAQPSLTHVALPVLCPMAKRKAKKKPHTPSSHSPPQLPPNKKDVQPPLPVSLPPPLALDLHPTVKAISTKYGILGSVPVGPFGAGNPNFQHQHTPTSTTVVVPPKILSSDEESEVEESSSCDSDAYLSNSLDLGPVDVPISSSPASNGSSSSSSPRAPADGSGDVVAPSAPIVDDDIDIACDFWKFCLLGYVSGKFPGYKALSNIIFNSWHYEAKLHIHDLDEYFDFNYADMSTVPVWIKLPNLPLKCWSSSYLSKIASALGPPCYECSLVQQIVYETLPKFASIHLQMMQLRLLHGHFASSSVIHIVEVTTVVGEWEIVNKKKHSSRNVKQAAAKVEAFRLKRWKFWTNVVASSTARIVIFWNHTLVKVVLLTARLKLVLEDKKLWLRLLNLKLARKCSSVRRLSVLFFKIVTEEEVGAEFVVFFQNLYGTSKSTLSLGVDVLSCGLCISERSSALLFAPVSNDDIKTTLFGIGNDKAPGLDGYTSLFFKSAWSIIGDDFCMAINHSLISLIPKSAHASTPNDFRPISCCNVIYKVISKLLVNHLSIALGDIISPMQNAFLGGRAMADNINLVQELLRQYGKKRTSSKSLMKIDFKKAFDSVQWSFIQELLGLLGFASRFIHLFMQCVETTSFSIAINGHLYGFFLGKSGIWQGDPLSPYLFITCMEYFSRMLKGVSQQQAFRDKSSVLAFLRQLEIFGKISCLEVNPSKSSIYFGGVGDDLRQEIIHATGFAEGSFPFKYLGMPLSPNRLLVSQFSPLLRKLQATIQSWVGKHLSYAGRLVLLCSVLYGMIQFWISIFPLSDIVITNTIRLCRIFLWIGNVQKSHSALVAWKNVCLPKQEGGVGLFDIKARNKSFLINLSRIVGVAHLVIATIASWSAGTNCFSANAYEHFRVKGRMIYWDRVVWEPWSLPKHYFVVDCGVRSRIVIYSSSLWRNIVRWLHIHRRISSLPSAIHGLFPKRRKMVSRIRRASLAISVYLIWEEHNKRLFDSSSSSVERVFRRFQLPAASLLALLVVAGCECCSSFSSCFLLVS
uniref:Reverse transcriptase domain-containing protein n=1 Tax=Salix viminalis TaxID=40686 RepID=A0A6N2LZA0_SALVM